MYQYIVCINTLNEVLGMLGNFLKIGILNFVFLGIISLCNFKMSKEEVFIMKS